MSGPAPGQYYDIKKDSSFNISSPKITPNYTEYLKTITLVFSFFLLFIFDFFLVLYPHTNLLQDQETMIPTTHATPLRIPKALLLFFLLLRELRFFQVLSSSLPPPPPSSFFFFPPLSPP